MQYVLLLDIETIRLPLYKKSHPSSFSTFFFFSRPCHDVRSEEPMVDSQKEEERARSWARSSGSGYHLPPHERCVYQFAGTSTDCSRPSPHLKPFSVAAVVVPLLWAFIAALMMDTTAGIRIASSIPNSFCWPAWVGSLMRLPATRIMSPNGLA